MKCLIIQENGRHLENRFFRECYALQKAFTKNNIETDIWGLGHSNYSVLPDFELYDIIFMLENYDLTGWVPDLSKTKKPFKICWAIDAHSRGIEPFESTFKQGKYNLLLHATLDYCDNVDRIWFPCCLDDTVIYPKNVSKRVDVGFCGNVSNRLDYLEFLSRQTKFSFVADVFVLGDSMVNAINSYTIHFNKNALNDLNFRNFETIGCKVPLITNFNSQYPLLGFKDSENCIFYSSKDELIEKIVFFLNNKSLLGLIAENGFNLSTKHTYYERVKHLLHFIKGRI